MFQQRLNVHFTARYCTEKYIKYVFIVRLICVFCLALFYHIRGP